MPITITIEGSNPIEVSIAFLFRILISKFADKTFKSQIKIG